MLISSYEHSVDVKGRVFIPARWREDLGDTVVVTRGMMGKGDSRCLFGMSVPVWCELQDRFKRLALTDVKAQNAMRLLFAYAAECELDKQGRILLNASLREQAGITDNAVLIGVGNRIEIWNADSWKLHMQDAEDMSDEVLTYLTELGI